MGPKKASQPAQAAQAAGVKRKTPEEEETTYVAGPARAAKTEPKDANLDAGSAAKGGNTGFQQAGLTANSGERKTPTKPSQRDIDSGVAIQVKEYMKALIAYVHAGLTAFLRQKDPDFKGILAEVKTFEISP